MESELFTIGDLARASGLTVSALRFYDRAGVLPPAYVDPQTGYRWYAPEQVRPARIVAGLRRVSMPLADICRVLAQPADAPAVLAAHLRRLERGVADARRELSRVRALIEIQEPAMTSLTVPSAELAASIDAVRFAVSTDPALPALAGVLMEVDEHEVRLVATDRYRLAFASAGARDGTGTARAVVPAAFLDEARQQLSDGGTVTVTVDGTALRIGDVDGTALPDEFPDYRRLLPDSSTRSVPLDVATLRAGLAAAGPVEVAVLNVGPDDSVTVDGGPQTSRDLRIGVNPEFLLQAITAITAAGRHQLVLELDGPIMPLVLRPPAPDAGTLSLLMPVRIPA